MVFNNEKPYTVKSALKDLTYSLECSSSLISASMSLSACALMSLDGFNVRQMFQPYIITFSWRVSGKPSTQQHSASSSDHFSSAITSKMNNMLLPLAILLLSSLLFRLFPLPVSSSILTVQENLCSLLLLDSGSLSKHFLYMLSSVLCTFPCLYDLLYSSSTGLISDCTLFFWCCLTSDGNV